VTLESNREASVSEDSSPGMKREKAERLRYVPVIRLCTLAAARRTYRFVELRGLSPSCARAIAKMAAGDAAEKQE